MFLFLIEDKNSEYLIKYTLALLDPIKNSRSNLKDILYSLLGNFRFKFI